MRCLCILIIIFTALNAYAQIEETYPFQSALASERFKTLTENIRCVVCQNQNIADSNAPLANDLRAKVYEMVLADKSDKQIEDYLVQRYGEFILLKPRLSPNTLLLWLFPLLGLSIAGFLITQRCKHTKKIIQ